MEKIKKGDELSQSLDIVNDNISRLKELFPEVFTEGKIDFKVLQDILGDEIETEEEYYRFTWAGKAQARREAHKPSTGTLRPAKEESVNWDTTENLYIEGDNLEVLKLLQKSYNNKVKMIYIDPPYNTGNDFVYKDNYKDNLKNYQQITGQVDDEGNKLFTNTESDGRYHSNWLNMMYPRLSLARNLLTEDGVIFISIDDNEIENLKKIGKEIFGEGNFIASIIWKHTQQSKNDERFFSRQFNYNIVFSKNINKLSDFRFERTESDNKNYSNPDNDPKGKWRSGDVRSPSLRKTLCFKIIAKDGTVINSPEKGWRWSEDSIKEKIETGEIIFKSDNSGIIRKIYLNNQEGRTPENVWNGEEYGTTRIANAEIKKLFEDVAVFDTPKPSAMIKKLIQLFFNQKDFTVLDFFSGSATTAQAIMQLNLEDGGSRKHIQVQLPESIEEKSDAFMAGYKTITEIGKERIRRAGKLIINEKLAEITKFKAKKSLLEEDQEEINNLQLAIDNLDTGFKVFKLDSSNIKGWDGNPDNLEQSLFDSQDNIKTDRTEEDVLFEILLKYGLDLTLPIEEKIIEGKKVFNVGLGALFICLANGITSKIAEEIGAWKQEINPETCRVIFKDSGFTDVEKTNAVQTLKRFGINEIKSI